jgi:hypothetical protein
MWAAIGAIGAAGLALIGTIITVVATVKKGNQDILNELKRQSEISDQKLEAKIDTYQAVVNTKIEELTREVREHNNFARRMPVVERDIENINKRMDRIETDGK